MTWTSRHISSLTNKVLELVSKLVVHSSIISNAENHGSWDFQTARTIVKKTMIKLYLYNYCGTSWPRFWPLVFRPFVFWLSFKTLTCLCRWDRWFFCSCALSNLSLVFRLCTSFTTLLALHTQLHWVTRQVSYKASIICRKCSHIHLVFFYFKSINCIMHLPPDVSF